MDTLTASEPREIASRLAVNLDRDTSEYLDPTTVDWVARQAEQTSASPIVVQVLRDPSERPVIRGRALSVLTAHIQASAL